MLMGVVLERVELKERRMLSRGTLAAGPHVRLAVSDTGTGIPPAVSSASSILSSPPNGSAKAPGSACRSCMASLPTSAAPST